MILPGANNIHLTYCTNVHPGQTINLIKDNIQTHVLKVKAEVSPDAPFGVGLWIPGNAADKLVDNNELECFKKFLSDNDLYVFTINGFPYGDFHNTPVKEKVYLPNWLEKSRLKYTSNLASILAGLLVDKPAASGSVSTLPCGFLKHINSKNDVKKLAENIIDCAGNLHRIFETSGKSIVLALEPEPFCYLETVDQTISFFKEFLFSKMATDRLRKRFSINVSQAKILLNRHLGVCFDACHFAVGFQEPAPSLKAFKDAGIKIGKVQISAGLVVKEVTADSINALEPFADDIYLHQVTEKCEGTIHRYVDLSDAIKAAKKSSKKEREWRIHFHVPLYQKNLAPFSSTSDYVEKLLPLVIKDDVTNHLEVETYTWNVLPEKYRKMTVEQAISKELQWVLKRI